MLILSKKYPELRLNGLTKFSGGKSDVSDPEVIERLRGFAHMGVVVPEATPAVPETPPAVPEKDSGDGGNTPPPADNEHVAPGAELFEPKGNASVEEWRAYAVQKGHESDAVADLKREDIKALVTE
ncbi:hypothetical protein [Paeniglutamicibacter terrestris]|uniref:Uncharacterized protein n=1 Tax=Paeniglutamicibacter terrestris TaxID=2723403 RepID=A0ABX1G7I1_9MICC|nr:hypothetical protein [Paeniglutamicibacter terrestris]NKG22212.1 hypothetical protein [Paeniglutamicibacter terrestris]